MMLSVRPLGSYKILDIGTPTRKYEEVSSIKEKIDDMLAGGDNFIALNVSNIDYMHSYFIKILTATYKKLKSRGGDLCVIGPNDFIRNLMKILNIDEYVGIYNSEESFRSFLNLPPA